MELNQLKSMELTVLGKTVKFYNMTQHDINVYGFPVIPPSGGIARVAENRGYAYDIGGIKVTYATFGNVLDLPSPSEGAVFLVSALVLNAVGDKRVDVLSPGPLIRDENGIVIGCNGLSCGKLYYSNFNDEL